MSASVGLLRLSRFIVMVAGLAHAGCDARPPATHAPTPATRGAATSWGSFYVTYDPTPDPLPLNQLCSLVVRVFEAADHQRPIADATLGVSARMPEHNHGTNLEPKVSASGNGTFRVEGLLLHMPGRWEIYADVTRGAETERATFEVMLD
jgi:hypothetical protein